MATMTQTRRPVKPTRNVCRLTLAINGTAYAVLPLRPCPDVAIQAVRLTKDDGTRYDAARTAHGLECSCPDFVFRRDGKDPRGCKHLRALTACGLLR